MLAVYKRCHSVNAAEQIDKVIGVVDPDSRSYFTDGHIGCSQQMPCSAYAHVDQIPDRRHTAVSGEFMTQTVFALAVFRFEVVERVIRRTVLIHFGTHLSYVNRNVGIIS